MQKDIFQRKALSSGPLRPVYEQGGAPDPSPATMRPPVAPGRRAAKHKATAWDEFFDARETVAVAGARFRVYTAGESGPLFVMLHGAGHSALSWAAVAKRVKGQARVLAYDMRGHGETETDDDAALSAAQLVEDCVAVVEGKYGDVPASLVLVGHSLGGAIAVRVADAKRLPVGGVAVLDVVEGTAMASLDHMAVVLGNRPPQFRSVSHAIDWTLKTGGIRTAESACVSVPMQVRETPDRGVVWRTDLSKTEPHWKGWFEGLSAMFLSLPAARILILAGTDRLDKELTIGQMQGKFQLVLLYGCGHAIHEDVPDDVAKTLLGFSERNRI